MISNRQLFLNHLAQTSPDPLMFEIISAEGIYLYGPSGKKYIDLIAGVSVSALGHSHPDIITAVKEQVDRHMHIMVYGELIQSPQVSFARLLSSVLGPGFENIYFVNSGAEAVEGAIKVARKATGRSEIISFKNAYHGSTLGALSIMGGNYYKQGYYPLLPDTRQLTFNCFEELSNITTRTACVIVEPIQAEAGIILPEDNFLVKLSDRCKQTSTLLVFDEIQTGFGRTGELFAFQKYSVKPDIIVLAKSLGGGMPLGAFISNKDIMQSLCNNPSLGHITTFGGHPVSCSAGLASLNIIIKNELFKNAEEKGQLFCSELSHPAIREIRGAGLLLSVELGSSDLMHKTIKNCVKNGLLTDWFLFCDTAIRISPPLIITNEEIELACRLLLKSINEALLED